MAWENGQQDPWDDPKEGEEGQAGNRQVVKPESVKNLSSVWGGSNPPRSRKSGGVLKHHTIDHYRCWPTEDNEKV
jgi:hypothetical protein